MTDPSSRMLRLLTLLQTHRFWPGTELADRLDVSPRTLRRDVDRLRELGYPVHARRGTTGGYQLQAGTALPPLLLDDDEAVAIAVGLRTAAGNAVQGIEETSVRALAKLEQVLPARLRRRVNAVQAYTEPLVWSRDEPVDPESLTVIAQACRDSERLQFEYAARGREPEGRAVEPHRLVSVGRRWYLVAWDTRRADWRTFRLDRLAGPRTSGARFNPRPLPEGDAAAFVRKSLRAVVPRVQADVIMHAPAEDLEAKARWLGALVEPLDTPGRCRLRLTGESLAWLGASLAALDRDFEIVEPPELRDWLQRLSSRIARGAGGGEAPAAV